MRTNLKVVASLVLATAVSGHAQVTATPNAAHKTSHYHPIKTRREPRPSVQSEIEQLRQSMAAQQAQIGALEQQLAARNAEMQQVQQQAQSAVQQAQQAAQQQVEAQQAVTTQNATAVASLQSAVNDLQTRHDKLAATVKADQVATKKAIENPDEIHYKGTTISPKGSFIEFATVNRTRATGSGINTPFTSIPYTASDAGQVSEFEASARQSRIALTVNGRAGATRLAAHYEMDWLGAGVTSNNNQSNSYVVRVRQLWAQAGFQSGLTLTAGQQWSLATENADAIDNDTEMLPPTIDPQYSVGFVWLRQPSVRVTYKMSPTLTAGISAEAEQTLTPSCSSSGGGVCPVNYLEGQSGTGGGLYNSTTTYSYNLAPALIAKAAFDPKMGHFEIFAIERNFRDRVYPNENPSTGKTVDTALSSGAGAYNDSQVGGAIGGSGRIHTYNDRLGFVLKGMYGDGAGRYASSQLPDTTVRPDGQLALLHNFAAYTAVNMKVTKRWTPYLLYGTEYVGHDVFGSGTNESGYGLHTLATSGCGTELAPGTTTSGYTPTNAGSCSVNNKDTREATAGWWYNIYDGPGGRLREGFQYSWLERNTYTGLNGITPTAIDNIFETSLRYYLP